MADNSKYAVSDKERAGLSSSEVESLTKEFGLNFIESPEVSLLSLFFMQFTGTMPYMLIAAMLIAYATLDYVDGSIILIMLLANAILGFMEEKECLEKLEELTANNLVQKITCQRDGVGCSLDTKFLVPGDIVLLVGGMSVPADIDWIEGDVLSIDTAQLTGEPLPRKYPSDLYANHIQCGCTIMSGEAYGIVRTTGTNTEMGQAQASVLSDKAQGKQLSVFEDKAMKAVQIILVVALAIGLCIFLFQGIRQHEFTKSAYKKDLLSVLAIIVASIPIALPIVLKVTMSIGASKMAGEFHAAVTDVSALQDIASMTVLCSDKTGTLTTAKMAIAHDMVWCDTKYTKKDVGLYGILSSNRDKKEDAIDRAVVKYFDSIYKDSGEEMTSRYKKIGGMGFNPIYKRVVVTLTAPDGSTMKVAKGLATKVLDTEDGGKDDAEEQWKCDDFERLFPIIKAKDKELSSAGYKTLGIAVQKQGEPWKYIGILPMLDPPRFDTPATIANLKNAGIRVKMITGDHLNIAIETARKIGMGNRIYSGDMVRGGTATSRSMINDADGFAQVLPSDKREVVEVLKKDFGCVVGMTGDGVNDAPALSAAQCGVAVDDATDAAKNASKILLTSSGLSAIYNAVVESRRIFRKLKSYITYRFAASIQIVLVLAVLIFASNCLVNPLYVILLALMNDLTMLPIAYDSQMASAGPEVPDVNKILFMSLVLGACETFFSLLFAYGIHSTSIMKSCDDIAICAYSQDDPKNAPKSSFSVQALIWLQMFVSSELLIFSARAPSHAMLFLQPSIALVISVGTGIFLACILCNQTAYFGALYSVDIWMVVLYCVFCLIIIDFVKVKVYQFLDESLETLTDSPIKPPANDEVEDEDDNELEQKRADTGTNMTTRESAALDRMNDKIIEKDERLSLMDPKEARRSLLEQSRSTKVRSSSYLGSRTSTSGNGDRMSTSSAILNASGSGDTMRGSFVKTSGSLRPQVPGQMRK